MKQLYPDLISFLKFKIVNSWLKCLGMSLDVPFLPLYRLPDQK